MHKIFYIVIWITTSNSFYLSLFLFALPVFMVVMWGGHLSVNLVLEKGAGQEAVGVLCVPTYPMPKWL